jgi:predicted dehydrogenase
VAEAEALAALAQAAGVSLFTAWHSREAAGVTPARQWLANQEIRAVRIDWKEDVRVWHPGQRWISSPGGFGVFDPGINALSILTDIIPDRVRVLSAELHQPADWRSPIAAHIAMETASGVPIAAEFDFRQSGPQSWDIRVEAAGGELLLSHGGDRLAIDGVPQSVGARGEYTALYRRFGQLVRDRATHVDLRPLQLVADCFLCASTQPADAFAY